MECRQHALGRVDLSLQAYMAAKQRLTCEQRSRIAKDFAECPNYSLLARRYKCSRPTVIRWVKEAKAAVPNFSDKARSGRPKVLASSDRSSIKRSAKRDQTAAKIAKRINEQRERPVSISTVRRIVAAGRKPLAWKQVNRGKVLSERNKEKRIEFCRANLKAHISKWVFIDGKFFYLYKTKHGYVQWSWQKPGKEAPPRGSSTPWVFFVYAAVAKGHKSRVYFVPPSPKLGSKEYSSEETFRGSHFRAMMELLLPEVRGWLQGKGNFSIILDRASQHTSAASKAALVTMGAPLRENDPAQSYDINVIQNVWALLNNKMLGAHARSIEGWRKAIEEAWNEVEQGTIDKLVAQLPTRMQKIIDKDGHWL